MNENLTADTDLAGLDLEDIAQVVTLRVERMHTDRDRLLVDIVDMTAEIARIEKLRVEYMRAARQHDASAQQVAAAAGVSRQHVYRITGPIS